MQLEITDRAAQELRQAIDNNQEVTAEGIRLGMLAGGCCGAQYTLSLADAAGESESVAESRGIKVFVSGEQAPELAGTVIDFVETPMGKGFHISNPNVKTGGKGHGEEHGHDGHGGHGHGQGGCACGSGGGGCGSGGCGC